jgi:hypothetical protein
MDVQQKEARQMPRGRGLSNRGGRGGGGSPKLKLINWPRKESKRGRLAMGVRRMNGTGKWNCNGQWNGRGRCQVSGVGGEGI